MAADDDRLRRAFWRVLREYLTSDLPPDPAPGELPTATPAPALPRAGADELLVTWVGHATALVQLEGLNILTDPVWSERASPLPFAGPRRFVPPSPPLERLPPVDAVLLSHDHYDHLDRGTVRGLQRLFGDTLVWYTPLRYRGWFRKLGVERVIELDWWEEALLPGGRYRAVAVPARHWTRRRPLGTNLRLWSGWAVLPVEEAASFSTRPAPPRPSARGRVYFAGDSGACPAFAEIGGRLGPFDLSMLPIGAYEPRWFMGPAHMNPEEAVRAYLDLGGQGAMVAVHWGTWRLTFEDPREPPGRSRAAWAAARLPARDLHVLRHGQTLRLTL